MKGNQMTQATASAPTILAAPSNKPELMVTLVCSNCRMALYMSDRKLHMPTWKCPSCGTVTRTAS